MTDAQSHYGFTFVSDPYGSCVVQATSDPPISFTFVVTLPRWAPYAGAPASTVSWWIDELDHVAWHEAHHVSIYRSSLPALNNAVANDGCASLESDLTEIFATVNQQNCLFDLKEYGYALGMTTDDCASG